jgi:hypothetical protein
MAVEMKTRNPGRCHNQYRGDQNHQQACATKRLNSRRREFVRRPNERIPAAE